MLTINLDRMMQPSSLPVILIALSLSGCASVSHQASLIGEDCRVCKHEQPHEEQLLEFEVSGLVRNPGIVTYKDNSIALERVIARAGGADTTQYPEDTLFVAVRNRDYKPAVTNYYALPLVMNSAMGQVHVSTDDVIMVVPQRDTVFGSERADSLTELRRGDQVFRLGTSDEGRDVKIAELDKVNGRTAAHLNEFVRSEYRVRPEDIDICVVTRNNWGGIGVARAIVPVNHNRSAFITASATTATTAATESTKPAAKAETPFDEAIRFGQTTPSASQESSNSPPGSERPGDPDGSAERTRQALGLNALAPVAPTASLSQQLFVPASGGSVTARPMLETIQVLGGDIVTVGNSALMPEVLQALSKSASRSPQAALDEPIHDQLTKAAGHSDPEDSFLYRALRPIEKTKQNIFNIGVKSFRTR